MKGMENKTSVVEKLLEDETLLKIAQIVLFAFMVVWAIFTIKTGNFGG